MSAILNYSKKKNGEFKNKGFRLGIFLTLIKLTILVIVNFTIYFSILKQNQSKSSYCHPYINFN